MTECLACTVEMPGQCAREGRLCEMCEAVLGTPEEAARSFAWAASEAKKAPTT